MEIFSPSTGDSTVIDDNSITSIDAVLPSSLSLGAIIYTGGSSFEAKSVHIGGFRCLGRASLEVENELTIFLSDAALPCVVVAETGLASHLSSILSSCFDITRSNTFLAQEALDLMFSSYVYFQELLAITLKAMLKNLAATYATFLHSWTEVRPTSTEFRKQELYWTLKQQTTLSACLVSYCPCTPSLPQFSGSISNVSILGVPDSKVKLEIFKPQGYQNSKTTFDLQGDILAFWDSGFCLARPGHEFHKLQLHHMRKSRAVVETDCVSTGRCKEDPRIHLLRNGDIAIYLSACAHSDTGVWIEKLKHYFFDPSTWKRLCHFRTNLPWSVGESPGLCHADEIVAWMIRNQTKFDISGAQEILRQDLCRIDWRAVRADVLSSTPSPKSWHTLHRALQLTLPGTSTCVIYRESTYENSFFVGAFPSASSVIMTIENMAFPVRPLYVEIHWKDVWSLFERQCDFKRLNRDVSLTSPSLDGFILNCFKDDAEMLNRALEQQIATYEEAEAVQLTLHTTGL